MLYDRRDFGLLRLAGTYQWLPAAPLKKLSALKTLRREAELLSTLDSDEELDLIYNQFMERLFADEEMED